MKTLLKRFMEILTCLIWVLATAHSEDSGMKTFCYFTNWSKSRPSDVAKFQIEDIDASLCSHLLYAFASINTNSLQLQTTDPADDIGQNQNGEKLGRYYEFTRLKNDNPGLVTLLSVGGARAGSGSFTHVVQSDDNMNLFAKNVATFLRDRGFGGLDIDWEYPASAYRQKFTLLLKTLREEFTRESEESGEDRLLLTIAVAVGSQNLGGYNVTEISRYVDYIQLMTYDFHGPWSRVTSFNGPLYSRASNRHFNQELSQDWAVKWWLEEGAPAHKLVMGVTATALTFLLQDPDDHGVGVPVSGAGPADAYLMEAGHCTYYHVCEVLSGGGVTQAWDNEQKMNYAYTGNMWYGYNTATSIQEKVKYAMQQQLAGLMVWSLDLDDFNGTFCNQGKYPLLTSIRDALLGIERTTTTRAPVTGTITSSVTMTTDGDSMTTAVTPTITGREMKSFCYFTNWSDKRKFGAAFNIRDINTTLCSHLIYAFASIDTNTMRLNPTDSGDDNGRIVGMAGRYYEFTGLKNDNPDLVTLLSVGGATARSVYFTPVVQSDESIQLFAKNAAIFLRDRGFDGLDVDWEYPTDAYRDRFTLLLKALREEFAREAEESGEDRLLLTIAVAVGSQNLGSYNVPEISQYVDFIHLMTYDFHGPWNSLTSFNGPLYSRASSKRFNQELSQDWAVKWWLQEGAPANKLVMGFTATALTFLLEDPGDHGVGAPATSGGPPGNYLGQTGRCPYYHVCQVLSESGVTEAWDDEQKMNYAYTGNMWYGYNTATSVQAKVKYAAEKQLAGMMFWSLDLDDFSGNFCKAGKYPLVTAMYDAIQEMKGSGDTSGTTRVTSPAGLLVLLTLLVALACSDKT